MPRQHSRRHFLGVHRLAIFTSYTVMEWYDWSLWPSTKVRFGSIASVSRCPTYVRSTSNSRHFRTRSALRIWAKCGYPARQSIKERGRRDPPNRMASNGRRSPGKSARCQWPLGAGLSCFEAVSMFPVSGPAQSSAREIPGIAGPGHPRHERERVRRLGPRRRRQRAQDRRVGCGQRRPRGDASSMPPSSTTYLRPTSYPGSPPPVIFPNTRPVVMPGFRLHRHRH
jgi:hypothetical protein